MNYGEAMTLVRKGKTVKRSHWNVALVFYDGKQIVRGFETSPQTSPYIPTVISGDIEASDWVEVKE